MVVRLVNADAALLRLCLKPTQELRSHQIGLHTSILSSVAVPCVARTRAHTHTHTVANTAPMVAEAVGKLTCLILFVSQQAYATCGEGADVGG